MSEAMQSDAQSLRDALEIFAKCACGSVVRVWGNELPCTKTCQCGQKYRFSLDDSEPFCVAVIMESDTPNVARSTE